jgi:hypothetical protein
VSSCSSPRGVEWVERSDPSFAVYDAGGFRKGRLVKNFYRQISGSIYDSDDDESDL